VFICVVNIGYPSQYKRPFEIQREINSFILNLPRPFPYQFCVFVSLTPFSVKRAPQLTCLSCRWHSTLHRAAVYISKPTVKTKLFREKYRRTIRPTARCQSWNLSSCTETTYFMLTHTGFVVTLRSWKVLIICNIRNSGTVNDHVVFLPSCTLISVCQLL
jgi:hypothetical protein